ncbi:MAG: histidinol-phosphatase HisJ family protein [Alphaproteobacteria bacterium]|nr:histidinol-phosphatase HisJ family protein [Alphaproteobacteria bacterium]
MPTKSHLLKKASGKVFVPERQRFNLHAHFGSQNIKDQLDAYHGEHYYPRGNDGAYIEDMLMSAEHHGFNTYGFVSHLDFNRHHKISPNPQEYFPGQFNDVKLAKQYLKSQKTAIDWRNLKPSFSKLPKHYTKDMDILRGLEVDFYRGGQWRQDFQELMKNIGYDYLIGAAHNISNNNGTVVKRMWPDMQPEDFTDEVVREYFETVKAMIASGLFDFIAHIDLIAQYRPDYAQKFTKEMNEIADLLEKHNTAVEINTQGWAKQGQPFPGPEFLKILAERNIKFLISDDAHKVSEVGKDFDRAEEMLGKLGIGTDRRFEVEDLWDKKPNSNTPVIRSLLSVKRQKQGL